MAVALAMTAALGYQLYRLVWSEESLASQARVAYAVVAATELSREVASLVENESRALLLPAAASAAFSSDAPVSPSVVMTTADARWSPGPGHMNGRTPILRPSLAFRLDLSSGSVVAVPSTLKLAASDSVPGHVIAPEWLTPLIRGTLREDSTRGSVDYEVHFATIDSRLIAFMAVPVPEGGARLVYGVVADADVVAHDAVVRVMTGRAFLAAVPWDDRGRFNEETLSLSVQAPDGRSVFSITSRSRASARAQEPVALAMRGPLSSYTVHVAVSDADAPGLISRPWEWNAEQGTMALLVFFLALLLMTIWRLRQDGAMARLRNDFVASVSHELRTPLAQIRMFSEMLRLGWVRNEAERERAVAIIDIEARRLTNLVENVLQFSTGEEQPRRIVPRPLPLAPFMEEVVHGFDLFLEHRQTRIQLSVDRDLVAFADQEALRQVLLNLLDNALKYGPPGQTVTVAAESAGAGGVRLWVQDEGPGIPAADRRRVFEAYRRSRRDVDAGITGSGIGLTVVRDLVRAHGGAVWTEDVHPTGVRIVVTLPPAPVPTPESPTPPDSGGVAHTVGGLAGESSG